MNREVKKMKDADFEIEHSGKHHLVAIESKKGLPSGKISNFGERGLVSFAFKKGKVSGEISHSSDNHSASLVLRPNGTWKGKYSNKWNDGDLVLSVSKGKVRPSDVDLSFEHKGKNHKLLIAVDQKGKLSGQIVRKAPNMGLELKAQRGGRISGSVNHKGQHHDLNIVLNENGTWGAGGTVKTKGGVLRVSIKKGEGKVGFEKSL